MANFVRLAIKPTSLSRFFNTSNSIEYLYLLIATIITISCTNNNTKDNIVHFGGQIINPKSDKVYIYKNNQVLDSSKLNIDNKFLIKLDTFSQGLYTFKHGNEHQWLYLEPNDSLLIRLNTWDFDESLVFSGKGAERNNFLINIYLVNQKEDKLFYKFYHLNDSLFQLKVDSILKRKNLLYSQFKSELPENSLFFEQLVNSAINYPLFKKKEAYPYLHMMSLRSKKHPKISPSFFKFRKNIDINNEELNNYYPHQQYIEAYLSHLAYEKQILDSFKSNMTVNIMQAALENIKSESIKNRFLRKGVWITLLDNNTSTKEKDRAKRLFFDHCTDKKRVEEIEHLINVSSKLVKNHKFPEITPYNFNGEHVNLKAIIKGKSAVIYTWPTKVSEMDYFAKRVKYLEKKYPNYLFIGINSVCSEYQWKKKIKSNNLNQKHQYRVDKGIDWLDINFSRAIIVDKNGIVQNNMTHLANRYFETQLK